ncbi:PPE domain-containing protein, partial [Actinophytocola sp.]|uniref:PPE domain-containing protein n=1 Tax=Actinophytocola sp. TaxID=1872138 RepID=UPI003D6B7195
MNDLPDDFDRNRLRETWTERHPRSNKAERRLERRRRVRKRNRKPGHFGKANWEAYQHFELYNMIMKAEPKQMYRRAEEWKALSNAIEDTTAKVQKVVEQVMGVWQGQAAVNAGASTTRLMQWAGTASHTAGKVAANMSDYTDAVSTAQRHMPPPGFATAERNFRDGYTVMTTGGPADAVFLKQLTSDGMVSHQEARARKAEAVAVMEGYESQSKSVHDGMPHFTDHETPIQPQPDYTPTPDPPAGGTGGGSGTPGVPPAGSGVPAGNGSTTAAGFVDSFGPGTGPGGGPQGQTTFGGPGSLNSGGGDAVRGGAGFGAGGPG